MTMTEPRPAAVDTDRPRTAAMPDAPRLRAVPDDPRLRAVVALFESLRPDGLHRIDELYASDASFKDPFNDVRGHAAIRRIFEHMFRQVAEPRFEVDSGAVEGDLAFLAWTMRFRRHGRDEPEQRIRGCTALRFDAEGRVAHHRDYWDAAEELYEKLPLLGLLMRALRRRLAA